ncbi:WD-repeat protein [Reticulomyxa filosa]|uniref:WD-repeat protein n=1 Tax=Reticulomyxa filosa TaxID=46433 RepID=X6P940_RETFI|nr:WD-repeat protein [Reticulomyxa filosa]|eukprot:ETO34628.1 WD-repeat protein [Reticulomyxa filosa]
MLDTFRSSSKLFNTFCGHTNHVLGIDYSIFNGNNLLCSGSSDQTVRVWNVDNNKQIQLFDGHSGNVFCVKFSQYHYHYYRQNVICSSSFDHTIRFWDFKNNQQVQMLNKRKITFVALEFSPFSGGRYLCSGSDDNTIHLWDVETYKPLHVFNGHENCVRCVDISPLQTNSNNNNENNCIGVIGGNGYTICSGSYDATICIWDIETAKQYIILKGHKDDVDSVKYGSNELLNTVLSGSDDKSVCLWDIRSGQQIQVFNGHTSLVCAVEYSPFIVDNNEVGGTPNVICSGSLDNTIRFWDIRSNKRELYAIKGNDEKDIGITCFKFLKLKNRKVNNDRSCINLCYGSGKGPIRIWE